MSDTQENTKGYVVVGAAVVLRADDGSERYLYRGAPVNADAFSKASIKHAVAVGLIAKPKVVESAPADAEEGVYKGVKVADLKADLAKRNEGREGDAVITPAEPGNRPEIVAALLADDEKNK
jgi:hypothetical protein